VQVRSFFSADEYWQSLEVAHRVAFGCVLSRAPCAGMRADMAVLRPAGMGI
jgi:hypothetical protein